MRKIKKIAIAIILSFLGVFTIIKSNAIVHAANVAGTATFSVTSDKEQIAKGEDVTLSVYVEYTGTTKYFANAQARVVFNKEVFEYKASSAKITAGLFTSNILNATQSANGYVIVGGVIDTETDDDATGLYAGEKILFATLKLTVLSTSTVSNATITLDGFATSTVAAEGITKTSAGALSLTIGNPNTEAGISKVLVDNTEITKGGNGIYETSVASNKTSAALEITPVDGAKITSLKADNVEITAVGGVYTIPLATAGDVAVVQVSTIAQDGIAIATTGIYITREKYDIATLAGLTITQSGSTINPKLYDGSNVNTTTFSSSVTSYTLRISEGSTSLGITPTVTNGYLIKAVTINGLSATSGVAKNISTASLSKIEIEVTAQDETTTTKYIIDIVKLDDDVSLEDLEIKDNDNTTLTTTLSGNKYTVETKLAYTKTGFTINAKLPEDSKATMTIDGVNVSSGTASGLISFSGVLENKKSINIVVTSESGITKTYTVEVTRVAADTDTSLGSIIVTGVDDGVTYDKESSSTATNFYYELPSMTGFKGTVKITLTSEFSTFTVNGEAYNENTIYSAPIVLSIVVTAQSGATKTYTISLSKSVQKDTNNEMSNLSVTDHNISPVFDKQTTSYTLTVPYLTSQVTINVSAASSLATIIGSNKGLVSLSVGTNTFKYKIKSESGTESVEYTLTITRTAGDTINTLDDIEIDGVSIDSFSSSTLNYVIRVDHSVSEVTLNAIKSSDKATINYNQTASLSIGRNTITIIVTSETGVSKTYTLTIYRADDDHNVDDIEVFDKDNQTLFLDGNQAITFNASTLTYEFSVSYKTNLLNFVVTTSNGNATVTGDGTKNLAVGLNTITIKVTSEYGLYNTAASNTSITYTIKVTREAADTDTSLSSLSLTIGGVEQIIDFDPSKLIYIVDEIDSSTTSVFITAVANSSKAVVSGNTGNVSLNSGSIIGNITAILSVTITAESGAIATYEIKVSSQRLVLNDNNEISKIEVIGSDEIKYITFNPTTLTYNVTLPYGVSSYSIVVSTPSGAFSTVTITNSSSGVVNIGSGATITNKIYATSESGVKGTEYTIVVNRTAGNSDSTLSSIKIDGTTMASFNKGIITYTILRGYNVEQISIEGIVNNTKSTLVGNGTFNLVNGLNTFNLQVTAEDGTSTTYTITVKKDISEPILTALGVTGCTLTDENGQSLSFNSTTMSYYLTVPFSKSQITISALCNTGQTITGNTGLVNLIAGQVNTFTYIVTTESGMVGSTYTLYVTRENGNANNTLDDITIDGNSINEFNSGINNYTIRVSHSTTYIVIGYEKTYASSTAVVSSNTSLNLGRNTITITVTSETGIQNVYTLEIYRADDDYSVSNIEAKDASGNVIKNPNGTTALVFNAETLTYNLTVAYSISNINIIISAATNADITNGGVHNLNVGINTFNITIRSEYGKYNSSATNTSITYTIIVTREPADTDSSLNSLSVKIGGVEQINNFDKSTLIYNIDNVGSSVTSLLIAGTATSSKATITGLGNLALNSGTISGSNSIIFTIKVTAEDGSFTEYKIVVSRETVNLQDNNEIIDIKVNGSNGVNYITFDTNTIVYYINLPYAVSSYTIIVTTPSGVASIVTIDRTQGSSRYYSINAGQIITNILYATSESGQSGINYVIIVDREEASNDATLEWIKIDGVTITGFASNKYSYNVKKTSNVESISITAKTNDLNAIIISGKGAFNLVEGSNIFTIIVQAHDGVTMLSYTITVIKDYELARLSELYIIGHDLYDEFGNVIEFDPSITTYYLSVNNSVDNIDVIARTIDSTARIEGAGINFLNVGKNKVTIYLIPVTGVPSPYTIIVTRKGIPSASTDLDSIIIDEIPTFSDLYNDNKNEYYYNDTNRNSFVVESNITSLNITVIVSNLGDEFYGPTTYQIIGANNLLSGENTIVIYIVASDLISSRIILIHVYRNYIAYDVVNDTYDNVTIDAQDGTNTYNLTLNKTSIKDIDFTKFVKPKTTANVEILSEIKDTTQEVIIRISNGIDSDIIKLSITDNTISTTNNKKISPLIYAICGGTTGFIMLSVAVFMVLKKRQA